MLKFLYYSNQPDQHWKPSFITYEGFFRGQVRTRRHKHWISEIRPSEVKTWTPLHWFALMQCHPQAGCGFWARCHRLPFEERSSQRHVLPVDERSFPCWFSVSDIEGILSSYSPPSHLGFMAATLSGTTRKDFPPSLEENCTEGKNSTAEEVLGKKKGISVSATHW